MLKREEWVEGFVYRSENEWKLFQEGFLEEVACKWRMGWVELESNEKAWTKQVKHLGEKNWKWEKRPRGREHWWRKPLFFLNSHSLYSFPKSIFNLDYFQKCFFFFFKDCCLQCTLTWLILIEHGDFPIQWLQELWVKHPLRLRAASGSMNLRLT